MIYDRNIERGKAFLSTLGTFWDQIFEDHLFLSTLLDSGGQNWIDQYRSTLEIVDSISRFDIPLLRQQRWYGIEFLESAKNATPLNLLNYGEGAVYGPQPADTDFSPGQVFDYGVPFSLSTQTNFELPADIKYISGFLDNPSSPTAVMSEGSDFYIDTDNRTVVFLKDPFKVFPVRDIYDAAGNVTDRAISLWAFNVKIDIAALYYQFAFNVGQYVESLEGYKDLTNAIYDCLVLGPSRQVVNALISAMFGVKTCKVDGETVERIYSTAGEPTIIVTDSSVYTFNENATPIVSVGDTLSLFDSMVDVVQFYYNKTDILNHLSALSLGSGHIGVNMDGELLFENVTSPIVNGRFQISGAHEDVEAFWREVRRRERETGTSITDYLGTSTNPLMVAVDTMHGGIYLIRVKGAAVDDIYTVNDITSLLPPDSSFIIINEVSTTDSVTSESLSETLGFYDCDEPVEEDIDPDNTSEHVLVKGVPEC